MADICDITSHYEPYIVVQTPKANVHRTARTKRYFSKKEKTVGLQLTKENDFGH